MQTINNVNSTHLIFKDFNKLYSLTSVKEHKATLIPVYVNNVFKPLLNTFYEYGHTNYSIRYKKHKYKRIKSFIPQNNKVIIAFSGGKDSTATALYYKDLGYDITLYHLRGINKTYKDEWKNAQVIADKLELPLVIEDIMLTGSQEWVEHPMKNMIIANCMLQYGLNNKITTNIAFGNFSTSTLNNDPFDVCGGDCREMWSIYEDIIGNVIGNFNVLTPLNSMADTLDILMQYKDIAVLCQSCIGPYRYREYLHNNNEKKYGISIGQHRCGSCWKCCLEYIVYCDNNIYNYNERYYKHCLQILKNTLKKEQGITVKLDDVWSHYFFYSKKDSKYYGKRR